MVLERRQELSLGGGTLLTLNLFHPRRTSEKRKGLAIKGRTENAEGENNRLHASNATVKFIKLERRKEGKKGTV